MDKWHVAHLERQAQATRSMYDAARYKEGTPFYHLIYLREQADKAERAYQAAAREVGQQ